MGTVKSFNASRGCGLIKPADGSADIIVHISEIKKAGHAALVDGVRVNYATKNGKPVAERLRVL